MITVLVILLSFPTTLNVRDWWILQILFTQNLNLYKQTDLISPESLLYSKCLDSNTYIQCGDMMKRCHCEKTLGCMQFAFISNCLLHPLNFSLASKGLFIFLCMADLKWDFQLWLSRHNRENITHCSSVIIIVTFFIITRDSRCISSRTSAVIDTFESHIAPHRYAL